MHLLGVPLPTKLSSGTRLSFAPGSSLSVLNTPAQVSMLCFVVRGLTVNMCLYTLISGHSVWTVHLDRQKKKADGFSWHHHLNGIAGTLYLNQLERKKSISNMFFLFWILLYKLAICKNKGGQLFETLSRENIKNYV
jgi:hypothetical protein